MRRAAELQGVKLSEEDARDIAAAVALPAFGAQTARRAVRMLLRSDARYRKPSVKERVALTVAFARHGMVLYGAAFDLVRAPPDMNLAEARAIEARLQEVTLCEVKSTSRPDLKADFGDYFFSLTTAELLVAQKLERRYVFVLINTATGATDELSLDGLLARAKGIYPSWSVKF